MYVCNCDQCKELDLIEIDCNNQFDLMEEYFEIQGLVNTVTVRVLIIILERLWETHYQEVFRSHSGYSWILMLDKGSLIFELSLIHI